MSTTPPTTPNSQTSPTVNKNPKEFHVIIRTREKIVYEGDVKAITSHNDKGPFDVLAQHANFISLIKDSLTIHKTDGTKQDMKVDSGIIKVENNQMEIYLGIINLSTLTPETGIAQPVQPQTKPKN